MKKTVFWIGVAVLVIGIVMFAYGYMTLQNMHTTYGSFLSTALAFHQELKQQWDLANTLEPVGLGIFVLGVIVLVYGL